MKKIRLPLVLFYTVFIVCCSKDDCKEEKKENCLVTFELNPVCGCNGVSYDNPSIAECHNITDYTMGTCK